MKTLDPEFKGVVFQYLTNALYTNQNNYKNFTLKWCRESLMTNHWVIYFRKGFYLVDEVNDKIRMFKTSGITNHMMGRYADEKFKKKVDGSDGPRKLTVDQFVGMFQLWGFGLVVATVFFICELVFFKWV